MSETAVNLTQKWKRSDQRHYMHPFTDTKELGEKGGARIITRAEGVYIFDSEGNKILDGMAGLWCVSLGYGRQELVDAATRQMRELPYYNSFFQCTHPPAIELSALLSELSPGNFNHVFFTGSGSEANDTQVKIVWYYHNVRGMPEKKKIIARRGAYHGSTLAGNLKSDGLLYLGVGTNIEVNRSCRRPVPGRRLRLDRPPGIITRARECR